LIELDRNLIASFLVSTHASPQAILAPFCGPLLDRSIIRRFLAPIVGRWPFSSVIW
jgi:hypothetical protein